MPTIAIFGQNLFREKLKHVEWLQATLKEETLRILLDSLCSTVCCLDTEGASCIRTLQKCVLGDEAPRGLMGVLKTLLQAGREPRSGHPAAWETCALGAAYLLPTLVRWKPVFMQVPCC